MKIDKRSKEWKQAKKVVFEQGYDKEHELYEDMILDVYKTITEPQVIEIIDAEPTGMTLMDNTEHGVGWAQVSNDTNIPEDKDNALGATPDGLGDKLEKVLKATGVKKVVEWIAGKDCGCDGRKKKLNDWGVKMGITRKVNCLLESEYIWVKEYNKRHDPKRFSKQDVSKLSGLEFRIFNKRTSICSNCNSAIKVLNTIVKDLNNLVDIYEIGETKELKP